MKGVLVERGISEKKRSLVTKEHTFFTTAQEVLVFWKGGLHWRNVHEVGDGMEVIIGFKREGHGVVVQPSLIENGLGLYQEFDEGTNKVVSYLYGFGKDEDSLAMMNELLLEFGIKNRVVVDGKFTIFEQTITEVDHKTLTSVDGLVSLLLGMLLGYGTFVGDDDALFHAVIDVPMVGSIAQYEELFSGIKYFLRENGLYIRTEYTTKRSLQSWSVGIYDWELLSILKKILGDQRVVGRKDEAMHLLETCNELTGNKYKFIKLFAI